MRADMSERLKIDLSTLKTLAQHIRDREWLQVPSTDMVVNAHDDDDLIAETNDDASVAAFIAAANPSTVLALIDELERRTVRAA
mgnify:CR=1 FL=1